MPKLNSSPVSGSILGWAAKGLTGFRAPPKLKGPRVSSVSGSSSQGSPCSPKASRVSAEGIDADVERRLQGDAAHQPVAREGGAEGAVERPAGGLLLDELGAAHEAGGEAGALRRRSGGRRPCRRRPASGGSARRRARSGRGRSGSRCRAGRRGSPPRPAAAPSAPRGRRRRPAPSPGRGPTAIRRAISRAYILRAPPAAHPARSVRKRAMQGTSNRQV